MSTTEIHVLFYVKQNIRMVEINLARNDNGNKTKTHFGKGEEIHCNISQNAKSIKNLLTRKSTNNDLEQNPQQDILFYR